MADELLTMFGKTYNTVGSANSNLLLLTRGDLKIRWGNKYIDLIKNGKINVDSEFIFQVGSKDEINSDGIYLIKGEESNEVWISVGKNLVNVIGEVNDNYVAFVKDQEVKGEDKLRALKNIGFYQENQDKAKSTEFTEGLVYILNEHLLYYYKEGLLLRYEQKFEVPDPLLLDAITIDGLTSTISGTDSLSFNAGNGPYIKLENLVKLYKNLLTSGNIYHETFNGNRGFGMYITNNNLSVVEADIIIARNKIEVKNASELSYDELMSLIRNDALEIGKKYTITDFFVDWYNYNVVIDGVNTSKQYYFPVTVTAKTSNLLEKEGYYCNNPDWVIEYSTDSDFLGVFTFDKNITNENNQVITELVTEEVFTHGRINKLTDEFGNSANFDFKHKLFKCGTDSDDKTLWMYAFNMAKPNINQTELENMLGSANLTEYYQIHNNCDASLFGRVTNMNISKEENDASGETLQEKGMIVFTDCANRETHDSTIKESKGNFVINVPFYDNVIAGIFNPDNTFQFNSNFHGNIFGNIYLKGNKDDANSAETVNMNNTIIVDSLFQDITDSTLLGSINSSQFFANITKLNFNGVLNKCIFNNEINNAIITNEISTSEFAKLSEGIELEGNFSNVKIVDDITPNSANYVLEAIGSNYTPINTLKVSTSIVPRLANTGTKECLLKVSKLKRIFYVKNGSNVEDTSPRGVIVMFSGTIDDIPDGWAICDGSIHEGVLTPDLRGRFIRSISDGESVGPKNNSDLVTNGNGTRLAYLDGSHVPKHTHVYKTYTHTYNVNTSGLTASYSGEVDISNLTVSIGNADTYYISDSGTEIGKSAGEGSNIYQYITTHTHTATVGGSIGLPSISIGGSASVSISITPELDTDNFPAKVNIEPLAYALIFIMKL